MENQISIQIPESDLKIIREAFSTIRTMFGKYAQSRTSLLSKNLILQPLPKILFKIPCGIVLIQAVHKKLVSFFISVSTNLFLIMICRNS